MATPVDGAAGVEFFRESGGSLSRAEINEMLALAGSAPISERMFRHYGKLFRLGYERYETINRVDVLTSADPIWDPRFVIGAAAQSDETASLMCSAGATQVSVSASVTDMSADDATQRLTPSDS